MATENVNIHSVRSARKGAKFLAPLTVMTTLIFLFLVMGVDVFILKAVAEPIYSIWWYLFWSAAVVLLILCFSGAIGLVFALFSAAIATIVDKHRTKAYIVMVGVLITGVASFLIRSAKSEDMRALESRAVAFHDPVFQEKVQSKQKLQDEVTRINNDRRIDNDHQIPRLQDKINAIDNELAALSDKYSNEARLADAALWLILLSCIVSIIIDFAYTYCVQKGWGHGHYSEIVIRQEKYDSPSSPGDNGEAKFSRNGKDETAKKNFTMKNKGDKGRKTQQSKREKRLEKLMGIRDSGKRFSTKKQLADELEIGTETLNKYLDEYNLDFDADFSTSKNSENVDLARQFEVDEENSRSKFDVENSANSITKTITKNEIITDRKTGLVWQYSASGKQEVFDNARKYILDLNKKNYQGFNDWRLPTLEEAESLDNFDPERDWIWTSDQKDESHYFAIRLRNKDYYHHYYLDRFYVKAVRG